MDRDIASALQVFTGIVVSLSVLTFVAVRAKIALDREKKRGQVQPMNDDRLMHLEQAVDAIAIEVERIAEGQRFATKLLAERSREEAGR